MDETEPEDEDCETETSEDDEDDFDSSIFQPSFHNNTGMMHGPRLLTVQLSEKCHLVNSACLSLMETAQYLQRKMARLFRMSWGKQMKWPSRRMLLTKKRWEKYGFLNTYTSSYDTHRPRNVISNGMFHQLARPVAIHLHAVIWILKFWTYMFSHVFYPNKRSTLTRLSA